MSPCEQEGYRQEINRLKRNKDTWKAKAERLIDFNNIKDKEIERLKNENEILTGKLSRFTQAADDLAIYVEALKEEVDDRIYLFYQALKEG